MWKIGSKEILDPENSIELALSYFLCEDPTKPLPEEIKD